MKRKIFCFPNHKGGIGKSTTCEALAAAFSILGCKVLVIDFDPTSSVSIHAGFDKKEGGRDFPTILDAFNEKDFPLSRCIQHRPHFDLIPSCAEAASLEIIFQRNPMTSIVRLREAIYSDSALDGYDLILIDGGPSQNILNTNILAAADYCVIPTECTDDSQDALKKMIGIIFEAQQYVNRSLSILGIVITRYEDGRLATRDALSKIKETADALNLRLFEPYVRRRTAVDQAKSAKMDLVDFAPNNDAAKDYEALAREILGNIIKEGA